MCTKLVFKYNEKSSQLGIVLGSFDFLKMNTLIVDLGASENVNL